MAEWLLTSQLLLIALLSCSVHCFPTKGWGQHDPAYEGTFTDMDQSPSLNYGSSTGAEPTSVNHNVGFPDPAVSAPYEPTEEEVYSGPAEPEAYQASYNPSFSNPSPDLSSIASGWNPEEETTTSQFVPRPHKLLPPPPPPPPPPAPTEFQAGELAHVELSYEHGNSEHESEEQSYMPPPPPPPPPPFPGSGNPEGFQAGELTHFASVYEHGDEERETQEQGFVPTLPYETAPEPLGSPNAMPASEAEPNDLQVAEAPEQPVAQMLRPVRRNQYYLFLTGQLPPGTITHYKSDYEHGRDHWSDVHYERYHFPIDQPPSIPTQKTQDVPSDSGFIYEPQEPRQLPSSSQPVSHFATKM